MQERGGRRYKLADGAGGGIGDQPQHLISSHNAPRQPIHPVLDSSSSAVLGRRPRPETPPPGRKRARSR